MDEDHESLRRVLKKRCPDANFRDDDIKKLVDAGYDTEIALASASMEALELVLPHRPGAVGVLFNAFVLPAEGEPLSKKTKRSPDEFQSSVPAIREQSEAVAIQSYFKKLLEAPLHLPKSVKALKEFLSARTIKLPVLLESTYYEVRQPDLVKFCTSEAEKPLATFVEGALDYMRKAPPFNESTSSDQLFFVTGNFLQHLNRHTPIHSGLLGLSTWLDSTNDMGTTLQTLKRPDFLLFVREALMLRWENRFDISDLTEAMTENASKLRVWSPLYYGTLPFVIGGCCGGGLFRWLKLSPNGKEIAVEPISVFYDLKTLRGVALFLHSTIRMYCLLQKLQNELTYSPPVKLYEADPRRAGEVMVYPDFVCKAMVPPLAIDRCRMLESLYDSIKGSRYLIQLMSIQRIEEKTILLLEPVGDPNARPRVLKDLEAAVHDILHGIVDLHKQGYTHRDLRWDNIIKVNVQGEWKWVIIDLETASLDGEEWVHWVCDGYDDGEWFPGDPLRDWDAGTLEDLDGKKIYTKGSDMYQLGKLILTWLNISREEDLAMRALGQKMKQGRLAAARMLEDICMEGCERCGKFDTKSKKDSDILIRKSFMNHCGSSC